MYIDKDSLIINGINMGSYITEATFSYNDTWSSDTGYTLSNKFVGEFKGTIPKITVKFGNLSTDQIKTLATAIFKTVSQTIQFVDLTGTKRTITTHKGDLTLKFMKLRKASGFSYDFVGNGVL